MNKKWMFIAGAVLFCTALAFAQEGSITYGEAAVVSGPDGVAVVGEEVTYPTQASQNVKKAADAKKAAAKKTIANSKAYQEKLGAQATQKANAAALKKGEPALKVNKTTTTTNVYDVSVTDKKGTTDYGIVEETVTNAQGSKTTGGVIYTNYTPSKVARANEKGMEVSFAAGMGLSMNEDRLGDRYSTNGLAAGASVLKEVSPHFSWGLDYMMLHPHGRTYHESMAERHYKDIYAHNIAVAGKYTINAWDSLQLYMPMGIGMMNARMKTHHSGTGSSDKDKWGASTYIGLGVQYDLTSSVFMGLEYRYACAFINDKDLTFFDRDKRLQFHSAALRLGMRF
ncbi:MAG: porin family protein [Elusimicrobiaceae bacterium]|nr:porin family protein [Elusimicrobiaceae bacterium]